MKFFFNIVSQNYFVSILLHFLFIVVSGLSFLWANATTTISEPPPISLTFIGAPVETSEVVTEKPQETKPKIEKKIPKITQQKKIVKPVPKKASVKPIPDKESPPPIKPMEETSTKSETAVSAHASKSITKIDPEVKKAGIAYEQALLGLLSKAKRYPERARRRGVSGDGIIRLGLFRDGSIKDLTIVQSTNSSILDKELAHMVERASPLPPLPPYYDKTEFLIPVRFSFDN
jgi:periplasmic protein TonB